jgi:hypothetical protein
MRTLKAIFIIALLSTGLIAHTGIATAEGEISKDVREDVRDVDKDVDRDGKDIDKEAKKLDKERHKEGHHLDEEEKKDL